MFNFKTLKLTKRCDSQSTNSFVGIRRNENGEVEFRLPHGFDDFPENDFEATKNLFFKMYRTFKKFERDNWRPNILDQRSAGKDNVETEKNGYRFKDKEENDVVLYSKITLIENLLDVYRDLSLDVIERRIGREEKIDYSKIDRYLDRAIYLPNDVIYIDEMELPRQTLQYEAVTLIDLFCFIVCELQTELENDIESRVQELAHRFSEQHLNHEESLFNEETFETTIFTLKNVLDDIHKYTAYKDEDYWRLFEAIELFLYGELDMEKPDENGIYWGINNFSAVWEDMCATWAFANFDVIYADTNIIFNGSRLKSGSQKNEFKNPFFISFRDKKRWMRPDLITQNTENLIIFDWKYLSEDFFFQLSNKLKADVTKQLCYEFSLKNQMPYFTIENQFCIPALDNETIENEKLHSLLKSNELALIKMNFLEIQAIYLNVKIKMTNIIEFTAARRELAKSNEPEYVFPEKTAKYYYKHRESPAPEYNFREGWKLFEDDWQFVENTSINYATLAVGWCIATDIAKDAEAAQEIQALMQELVEKKCYAIVGKHVPKHLLGFMFYFGWVEPNKKTEEQLMFHRHPYNSRSSLYFCRLFNDSPEHPFPHIFDREPSYREPFKKTD